MREISHIRDIRKRDSRRPGLEGSIGYELGRAFRRLTRNVTAAARPHGLSASQANVLLTLWAQGPMPIGELQALLALSSSAFTGALDRMEKADLVRRVPSPTDRRSFIVEPVAWSSSRRNELLDALLEAENDFLAALSKTEREALLELLRGIGGGD